MKVKTYRITAKIIFPDGTNYVGAKDVKAINIDNACFQYGLYLGGEPSYKRTNPTITIMEVRLIA